MHSSGMTTDWEQQVVDAEGISGEVIKVSDLTCKTAFGHRRIGIGFFAVASIRVVVRQVFSGFRCFNLKGEKAWAR
jgi:hypothetical protein